VLRTFPFLEAVWVDVSTPAALAAAPAALQQLVDSWPCGHSSSSGGSSAAGSGETAASSSSSSIRGVAGGSGSASRVEAGGGCSSSSSGGRGVGRGGRGGEGRRLEVELVGVPRCYHCHQVRKKQIVYTMCVVVYIVCIGSWIAKGRYIYIPGFF
jgi:hypothetical protein